MLAATYVTGRPAKSTPAGACAGVMTWASPATLVGRPVTVEADELADPDGEDEASVPDEERWVSDARGSVGEASPPAAPWSRRKPPSTNITTSATAAPIQSPGPGDGRATRPGARWEGSRAGGYAAPTGGAEGAA